MIEEIEVKGVRYRGIMPTYSADYPFKITVNQVSDKIGTGGGRVVKSWQTWEKYSTFKKAESAWYKLKYTELKGRK